MPILIALLGLVATVAFFVLRARNTAHAATELLDVANDVRLAARRFGFKRKTNLHAVETIEDPKLAIGGLASAFLALDALPSKDQQHAMNNAFRKHLNVDADTAQEMAVMGNWFVSECGGAEPAVTRISRKLYRLSGAEALPPLLNVINDTLSAGSGQMSPSQKEALDDVLRAFRVT